MLRAGLPIRTFVCLALGALLWACAQGEGERCERDEDCKGNLTCLKSANSISGRCTSERGSAVTPLPDSGSQQPAVDAATPVDQAVPADTAPPDTAPADTTADTRDMAGN